MLIVNYGVNLTEPYFMNTLLTEIGVKAIIVYVRNMGVKELWQWMNRFQGHAPRERFVYIAIIPRLPVDECYISDLIGWLVNFV